MPTMTAMRNGKPRTIRNADSTRNMPALAVIYWLSVHFLPVILIRLVRFSGLGISDTSILASAPVERFEMALRIRASSSASAESL